MQREQNSRYASHNGLIVAGPVTQAIHLPTLATLGDRLQVVVHIMDDEVGTLVASRTGARSTTSVQTRSRLEDPEVEVVATFSPGQFHAAQVEAATAAGKLAILCEKPLATTVEEAQLIADVSAKTSARGRGATYRTPPPSCVSQCNLPPNDDMVNLATELAAPAPAWLALRNPSSAKRKCRRIRNTLILGLVCPSKTTRLDGDQGY